MKKGLVVLLVALMAMSMVFAQGSTESTASNVKTIGVSMPTKSLQRWNQDGSNMKAELEKAGYNGRPAVCGPEMISDPRVNRLRN